MPKTRGGNKISKGGNKTMKGGVGSAAGYGVYEFGGIGGQTNNPLQGNVIAMNPNPAGYTGGRAVKGGSRRTGGTLVADAIVPVALIAANQLYKPKRRPFGKKSGGGDGLTNNNTTDAKIGGILDHASVSNDRITSLMNAGATSPPPATVVGAAPIIPTNVPYGGYSGGGSVPAITKMNMQGGVLTDIAVPAVLVAANQMYSPKRKTMKKRRFRRSRKLRFSSKKR